VTVTTLQAEYRRRAGISHDIQRQMPVLYAWARYATHIIELGVRSGNSTAAFLAGLEHGGGELWSVDITDPDVPAAWRDLPFWHLHTGDDTSPEAIKFCPDEADVLFIDTSHAYGHTMTELEVYVPKLRPGGVALLHDTCAGPYGSWPDVPRALDDWTRQAGLEWYNHPWWHGLGVIEIPQ